MVKQSTNSKLMQQKLDVHQELQHLLFRRGFLISKKELTNMDLFPFYRNWNEQFVEGWHFYTHKNTNCYIVKGTKCTMWLIGHCYNPFTMEWDEKKQLTFIAETFGTEKFQECINELTGNFLIGTVVDGEISFQSDAAGMQTSFYSTYNRDDLLITSHFQLISDLRGCEHTSFVKELIRYKWYHRVMGPYMPGDITPYEQTKRVVPNILYSYSFETGVIHNRFYPLKDLDMIVKESEYQTVISTAAEILKNNAKLITQKWSRPAISLTGGIDSGTTFASANGLYDKFETFSYQSAPKEVPDVVSAKKIAERFRTRHTIYQIPNEDNDISNFEVKAAILRHNDGYIAPLYPNEVRKRCYLEEHCNIEVEVKSWVSETIRAYWHKHFDRETLPTLSPKLYRNLYKIFLGNRSLAHKIDAIFADYIETYDYKIIPETFLSADMFRWEVTNSSWGGLNISDMRYCFEITIPYNNRKLLDLLLRVPLEKRISDQHHLDIKKLLNEDMYNMNIVVQNKEQTRTRARLLNIIFSLNMWSPF